MSPYIAGEVFLAGLRSLVFIVVTIPCDAFRFAPPSCAIIMCKLSIVLTYMLVHMFFGVALLGGGGAGIWRGGQEVYWSVE